MFCCLVGIFIVIMVVCVCLCVGSWEDDIRMDVKEIHANRSNGVDEAQDKNYWRDLVNPALNLRVS